MKPEPAQTGRDAVKFLAGALEEAGISINYFLRDIDARKRGDWILVVIADDQGTIESSGIHPKSLEGLRSAPVDM